jgi:hypothetical protein
LICNNKEASKGCNDVSFDDKSAIKAIVQAIEKAEPMLGDLNFVAEYTMHLTFKDGTTRQFDLSLGTNKGQKGLLVDHLKTTQGTTQGYQGYEIPIDEANIIRELIINSLK